MYYTAFLMALIAGFCDVFSFVALDHLFTSHITGNLVILISFLIARTPGIISKVLSIPLFLIFMMVAGGIIARYGQTRRMLLFWVAVEIFLILLLMVAGWLFFPLPVTSSLFILITLLPIAAMAIHNALLRTYMSKLPPGTAMTGNLTQFALDLTTFSLRLPPLDKALHGVKQYGNVLLGFLIGGVLGGGGYVLFGFSSLGLLILLLLVLLLHAQRVPLDESSP
ncbi:MAG: YoaK family protein [Parachlamydiales bacterium]